MIRFLDYNLNKCFKRWQWDVPSANKEVYEAPLISSAGQFAFLKELGCMEYMSVNQAAQVWGITPRRVQVLCAQSRIEGACRIGNVWAIPRNTQKPEDARIKSGKYVKPRE